MFKKEVLYLYACIHMHILLLFISVLFIIQFNFFLSGLLAESLLVDILGEKRLSAPQLTCTLSECDLHPSHFSHSEQDMSESGDSDIEGEWRDDITEHGKWRKIMEHR